jgi:putative ABC transport system permease protein
VTLATLAVKNVLRHKGRTALTALGIAVAIVLFTLMRTLVLSWTGAIEHAAKDRIATRHKVTFIMTLPKRYVDDIRQVPGVTNVTWANWFGPKEASKPNEFFNGIATDPKTFLDVYDEIIVDPKQAEAWKQNRRGALVGDRLAKQFGWQLGQRIVLTSNIFPGDWEFVIEGIYTAQRRSVDRSTLWFHWDYLNESPRMQHTQKDQVGWIVTRIDDPTRSGEISKQIDKMFDERDVQTLTMSEKALQQSFLGMISAILTAIDVVTVAILVIILLILGNTIAMAVRERTVEYGCLRAIGFRANHIRTLVIGESLTIGMLGGLLGLLIAQLFINGVMGPALEEAMGGFFPHFRIPVELAIVSLLLAAGISLIAAQLPSRSALKLKVADALRALD